MLLDLRAESYAVIERASVQFGPGLNLLTGETGAGKSILVDALILLLGGRASPDIVRHGSERAMLACSFEATPGAQALLQSHGIESDPEGELVILRREIGAGGKSRVFVNDQPATVGLLRQLAPELALVHAQSETLISFDQAQQRLLLDRFGRSQLEPVQRAFAAWRDAEDRLRTLEQSEQEQVRMADLWRHQAEEISGAAILSADEDTELDGERRLLNNAEKLHAAAFTAHDLLYENEHAAEATVSNALRQVEELAQFDPRFAAVAQQLAAAKASIEDASAELRSFADSVQSSPERLDTIEGRLALLERLKRKYGPTLRQVLDFGADAARRLSEVDHREAHLAALRADLGRAELAYRDAAAAVTASRTGAARTLQQQVQREINDLAMRVRFEIGVQPASETTHWRVDGWDTVEYRIATNAGEPLKPLTEIASGGEMSRVMLALKVAVERGGAGKARGRSGAPLPRTLIFDEIDVGIGGRAAEAVGQKLKALARTQQVLCITHLPQIAAFADQHFVVRKEQRRGRTETEIHCISHDERVEEIARMLSGASRSETSLQHAKQLLLESR